MDLVLLGFCLISLLITGFIVFLDISRRGTRKLDVPQENLPEFDESLPLMGMEVGETPELSDAEEDWKVESISSRDEPVEIQDKDSGNQCRKLISQKIMRKKNLFMKRSIPKLQNRIFCANGLN